MPKLVGNQRAHAHQESRGYGKQVTAPNTMALRVADIAADSGGEPRRRRDAARSRLQSRPDRISGFKLFRADVALLEMQRRFGTYRGLRIQLPEHPFAYRVLKS